MTPVRPAMAGHAGPPGGGMATWPDWPRAAVPDVTAGLVSTAAWFRGGVRGLPAADGAADRAHGR